MKVVFALFLMLVAGLLGAGTMSGTGPVPGRNLASQSILPAHLDAVSFAWGVGAGFVLCILMRTPWRELPRQFYAWLLSNRSGFRLAGWGLAFAAVLYLY